MTWIATLAALVLWVMTGAFGYLGDYDTAYVFGVGTVVVIFQALILNKLEDLTP